MKFIVKDKRKHERKVAKEATGPKGQQSEQKRQQTTRI